MRTPGMNGTIAVSNQSLDCPAHSVGGCFGCGPGPVAVPCVRLGARSVGEGDQRFDVR